ncbi:hypothetical protein Q7P37_009523 [Cladosporium fusiforme]
MATTKVPGKSILKQSVPPPPEQQDDESQAEAEAEAAKKKRNFDIAIKHALLIEHQRKTSDQILNHVELLLDFPASSEPTVKDASNFLQLVSIFQPSNFDELVEERRIDGKCGYPLCANEPLGARLKDSESWKLKQGAGDWCSNECTRKGLFVKAQLCEVPAWERVPSQQAPVVLHEDDRHLMPQARPESERAQAEKIKQRVDERSELAMERGEKATSFRPDQVMADFIIEKTPSARQPPMASKVKFASATAIEGYEPTTTSGASTTALPPVAEVAAILNSANPKAPVKDEPDSDDTEEDDDDEDQQWKDMFENMKKRG